jgi:Fe-S cluster biosynthesis and repair protein YggX
LDAKENICKSSWKTWMLKKNFLIKSILSRF